MAENDFRPLDEDPFGPGQLADGNIQVYTPEEASIRKVERDAEDAAFGDTAEPGGEESLEVDLDSMTEEDLDQLIEGLETEADPE